MSIGAAPEKEPRGERGSWLIDRQQSSLGIEQKQGCDLEIQEVSIGSVSAIDHIHNLSLCQSYLL